VNDDSVVLPITTTTAITTAASTSSYKTIIKKKKKSRMTSKHADDTKSGGIDALLPTIACIIVLSVGIMARLGFRGRATVAGIDLGTTNSVICVQSQSSALASSGGGGGGGAEIVCIPDPMTNSPIVPSVVSFLDEHRHRSYRLTKTEKEYHIGWKYGAGRPHPVDVLVGQHAKLRIDGHPHQTIYHAKRIIGREIDHSSVVSLQDEIDFTIVDDGTGLAAFHVPYHLSPTADAAAATTTTTAKFVSSTTTPSAILSPSEIGSYIIHHLMTLTNSYLGHTNIRSAVIAIPAKFEPSQRDATIRAYEMAGIKVVRILEEPTAAALAYGLHKRDDVQYVMVYDFGGGTLDVSILYIGEGGYIDVLGSDGDERLGGADFDASVARWLLEERHGWEYVEGVAASVSTIVDGISSSKQGEEDENMMNVEDVIEESCPKLKDTPLCTISSLHTLAERMKIKLSEGGALVDGECYRLPPSTDLSKDLPSTAKALCDSIIKVKLTLTLEEYDRAVQTLYDRSLLPIQRLLKDLGLRKDEIDEVVMVGGTTRMPQIRELVRIELEKDKLNTHIDPDLTVAYGAASVID
jgi:molecular chaperone DnaK (HSP70)